MRGEEDGTGQDSRCGPPTEMFLGNQEQAGTALHVQVLGLITEHSLVMDENDKFTYGSTPFSVPYGCVRKHRDAGVILHSDTSLWFNLASTEYFLIFHWIDQVPSTPIHGPVFTAMKVTITFICPLDCAA